MTETPIDDRAVIGDSPRRREDARFVTGHGQYLDDLRFANVVHAVFLRSPHAHARIVAIDTAEASLAPGVVAILTAKDAAADGLLPLSPTVEANVQTNEPFRFLPQPVLAAGKVRYVGEPVVLIVAHTRNQAMDAAERVVMEFDILPAVTEARDAASPGAPLLTEAVPDNLCLDWHWGQTAEVAKTIETAPHSVTIALNNHRIATNPMEPRGAVGIYDGRYTLHLSSQNLHGNRDMAARVLGVDPSTVRFVAPDVGGGFGAKNFAYAEHALILWAARRTGRPVKWIATRSETFLSDHQEVMGSIPLVSISDFNKLDDNQIEITPTGERLADQRRTNLKILQFDRDPLLGAISLGSTCRCDRAARHGRRV